MPANAASIHTYAARSGLLIILIILLLLLLLPPPHLLSLPLEQRLHLVLLWNEGEVSIVLHM